MRWARPFALVCVLACGDDRAAPEVVAPETEIVGTESISEVEAASVVVHVTLDGAPAAGARVTQGGTTTAAITGPDGRVTMAVEVVPGEVMFIASVPTARIKGTAWVPGSDALEIALTSYDRTDNEAYRFQDPGTPEHSHSTGQCGHCHVTLNADWYASPHRTSASNPTLHHLYDGSAGFADAASCAANGGTWTPGAVGKSPGRCAKGESVLDVARDTATPFGACADCHAPGIDAPTLGGRDLREAEGIAKDAGVHCDVCHRVDAIDLEAAAGVAGRLVMHRPSERSSSIGLGIWQPLTFGPSHDVPNPRMGIVQRDHFKSPTLCAGCHQYDQPTTHERWPDGRLPVHGTYDEWLAGPSNPDTACQGCHMPPALEVANGADLQLFGGADSGGIAAGWARPPGSVKHHSFVGPRQRGSELLESAASLTITTAIDGAELTAKVTVTNVFAGHAIPTGEPMRSLVMLVSAACDAPLPPIGGDTVPDFGGAFEVRTGADDWTSWPDAKPGEVIRVVRRVGLHDYLGPGAFADRLAGTGLPRDVFVAASRVLPGGGFDRPLPAPAADLIAYRGNGDALPADGDPATARAGAPGFAFAKVMVAADGRRMVPHFLAVDIASDNRLPPLASWTSTHVFAATCTNPTVHATLIHRAYPLDLAAERGWTVVESVMKTATQTN